MLMVLSVWCVSWKTGVLNRSSALLLKRVVCLCMLPVFVWAKMPAEKEAAILLPDLGSANRAVLSQEQEQTLSLAFSEALHQQADLLDDPELNDYVRGIGQRLLRHAHTQRQFQFYIVKDDSINAFAGPGGIIAVHTGLILAAKSEDELAAVMAHEIEHVQQEHISRMFEGSKKGAVASLAGLVGALLVGSQNPQAAMAMVMGGVAYHAQQQLAFSRDHEWEADRTGIDLLYAAGYRPEAMADFFETLSQRYRSDSKVPEILMTHPVTSKRITDSRARAEKLKARPARSDVSFQLAQQRLQWLLLGLADSGLLSCYQRGLAQLAQNKRGALDCRMPVHPWVSLWQAQQAADVQDSRWQDLLALYPQSLAVTLRYAQLLQSRQQYRAAIDILLPLAEQQAEKWQLWQMIARLWHELGDVHQEAYALAQAYAKTGMFKLAQVQIDRAQRQPNAQTTLQQQQALEQLAAWLSAQQQLREALK